MAFEYRFSRFLAGNWLHELNMTRSAFLDDDARNMVVFALDLAKRTHGYFDPTIGKRLTELGYGNQNILHEEGISLFESTLALDRAEVLYVKTGDYRDIHIE